MKKIICAAMLAMTLGLTSCGDLGAIYTGYTAPGTATSNTLGSKVGTAERISVLGLVAVGDAGVQAAAKSAGIKKVSHIDVQQFSVLGLFSKSTTVVYGE